jgi:predicted nuclease of predicted toxin-antitoxin system
VRIVVDMNLSPRWVGVLEGDGHAAVHWSAVGAPDAPDRAIMAWARDEGFVVFTHDLDFTALLAASGDAGPSVVQVRAQDVLQEALGLPVLRALRQFERELRTGALISVDPARARVRVLPLRP